MALATTSIDAWYQQICKCESRLSFPFRRASERAKEIKIGDTADQSLQDACRGVALLIAMTSATTTAQQRSHRHHPSSPRSAPLPPPTLPQLPPLHPHRPHHNTRIDPVTRESALRPLHHDVCVQAGGRIPLNGSLLSRPEHGRVSEVVALVCRVAAPALSCGWCGGEVLRRHGAGESSWCTRGTRTHGRR